MRSAYRSLASAGARIALVIAIVLVALWGLWRMGAGPVVLGEGALYTAAAIEPYRWWLSAARWVGWAVLWWAWDKVGLWLYRGDPEHQGIWQVAWMARRTRMMGAIALLEGLILINHLGD